MGNTIPTAAAPQVDLRQVIQAELPQYLFHELIGRNKLIKTIRAIHVPTDATGRKIAPGESSIASEGRVIIKIYIKRGDGKDVKQRISIAREQLTILCKLCNLRDSPNLIPYQRYEDTGSNNRFDVAFIIRQHFVHSLTERINTRPFLTRIDKLWLIYQLLRAVHQAHSLGIRHGDIKTENIMITSWNWLLLTDFAILKPTFLPADSPADFQYYFESGTRTRCYLAPERLVKAKDIEAARVIGNASVSASTVTSSGGNTVDTLRATTLAEGGMIDSNSTTTVPVCDPALRESMDIFSLGCTIAEIVLDGEPFFEQHTLLRYRGGGTAGTNASSGTSSTDNSSSSSSNNVDSLPNNSETSNTNNTSSSSSSSTDNNNTNNFDPMNGDGVQDAFTYMDPTGTIKDMVNHMIQRNPLRRSTAAQYLEANTTRVPNNNTTNNNNSSSSSSSSSTSSLSSFSNNFPTWIPPPPSGKDVPSSSVSLSLSTAKYEAKLFPSYFPYLFQFMARLIQPDMASADYRVLAVAAAYSDLLLHTTEGLVDPLGERLFSHRLKLEGIRGEPFRRTFNEFVGTLGKPTIDWYNPIVATSSASSVNVNRSTRRRRDTDTFSVYTNEATEHFSVGAQHASNVARELQWQWEWDTNRTDGQGNERSKWTDDFSDIADETVRNQFQQRLQGHTQLTIIHERWLPMRWGWVPETSKDGVTMDSAVTGIGRVSSSFSSTDPSTTGNSMHHPRGYSVVSAVSNGQRTLKSEQSAATGRTSTLDRVNTLLADANALLQSMLNDDTVPSNTLIVPKDAMDTSPSTDTNNVNSPSTKGVSSTNRPVMNPSSSSASSSPLYALKLVTADKPTTPFAAFGIILALLTSSLRRIACPRTKLTALSLISRFAVWADDDERLERAVPYIVTQFVDSSPTVRAHALSALTCILETVETFPVSDALLFPQYVLPLVSRLVQDAEPIVQLACGECIPRLVTVARRFLDITEWRLQTSAIQKAIATVTTGTAAATANVPRVQDGNPPLPPLSSTNSDSSVSETVTVDETGTLTDDTRSPIVISSNDSSSLDPSSFAKVRASHDANITHLRRKVHTLLQRWVLNMTQYATTTSAQLVLEDPAMMPSTAVSTRYAAFDGTAGGGYGISGKGYWTPADLVSCAGVLRVADLLRSLPLVVDTSLMKRALLAGNGIADLCIFFGREATEESVLSLLSTFLSDPAISIVLTTAGPAIVPLIIPAAANPTPNNDLRTGNPPPSNDITNESLMGNALTSQVMSLILSWLNKSVLGIGDWELRDAFLDKLVTVGTFMGPYSTQVQLLPFFEEAVGAPHEPVSERALTCIARLAMLRLLPRRTTTEMVNRYSALLLHPSNRIRRGAATYIAAVWQLSGWPAAMTDTATALNRFISPTHGDKLWFRIQSLLHRMKTSKDTFAQTAFDMPQLELVNALLEAVIPAMSRAQFDGEAHGIVLQILRDASPTLAARLRSGLVATGSHEPESLTTNGVPTPHGTSPGTNEFDTVGYRYDSEEDDEESMGYSLPATVTVDHLLDPVRTKLIDPPPFGTVFGAYAPSFTNSHDRRTYLREALLPFLRTVAGPYRLSVSTCTRMASRRLRAASQRINLETMNASLIQSAPPVDMMGAMVQDFLCGGIAPPPAYTEEEISSLPVRSISFPDQRYVTVHPQPPASASARTPNPQEDSPLPVSDAILADLSRDPFSSWTLEAITSPSFTTTTSLLLNSFGPNANPSGSSALSTGPHRRTTAGTVGGEEDLLSPYPNGFVASSAAALVTLPIPADKHIAANNPPLPEDIMEYTRIIHQQIRSFLRNNEQVLSTDVTTLIPSGTVGNGSSVTPMLTNGRTPSITVGHRRSRSTSLTIIGRTTSTGGTSLVTTNANLATTKTSTAHSRTSSIVSFAAPDNTTNPIGRDSILHPRQPSITVPFAPPEGSGTPLSFLQYASQLRASWRKAGRSARRLYLRHGIWNPLLATETTFAQAAGGVGIGTTTAFFYSSGRAALQDDPTLYESDDDTRDSTHPTASFPAVTNFVPLSASDGRRGTQRVSISGGFTSRNYSALSWSERRISRTDELERGRSSSSISSGTSPAIAISSQDGQSLTTDPQSSFGTNEPGTGMFIGGGYGVVTDDNESTLNSPVAIPGSAPTDPRVSPAVMAARFSAAAHAAITATAPLSIVPGLPNSGNYTPNPGGNLNSPNPLGPGRNTVPSTGSSLNNARRRTLLRQQDSQAWLTNDPNDTSLLSGTLSSSTNSLGTNTVNNNVVLDASFVSDVYEAEQQIHKIGAYRIPTANVTNANGNGLSGTGTNASNGTGTTTTAGVIINPSYLVESSNLTPTATSSTNTNNSSVFTPQASLAITSTTTKTLQPRRSVLSFSTGPALVRGRSIGGNMTGSVTPGPGTSVPHGLRGGDDRDFLAPAYAEALARRILALNIPPLPPNLGYLQKFSDPPAPLCAHAVRVATGVRPDAFSSVAVGVGSGIITSFMSKDEEDRLRRQGRLVRREVLDEIPRVSGRTFSEDSVITASLLSLLPVPPVTITTKRTTNNDTDDLSKTDEATEIDGFTVIPSPLPRIQIPNDNGSSSLISMPLSVAGGPDKGIPLPLVPVPLPVPDREDIIRPGDVGDSSGYIGSGRISFQAVERGWNDGIGIGAPPGSPLISTVAILPSTLTTSNSAVGTGAVSSEMGINSSNPNGNDTNSSATATPNPNGAGRQWDGGDGTWGSRPRGLLLTTGNEHAGSVNAIAVCQDHSFFASGSDDGTVKVWSTKALDREVAINSVLTYTGHLQETAFRDIEKRLLSYASVSSTSSTSIRTNQVTDVIICDSTSTIASGSLAGTVHIYRIDITAAISRQGRGGSHNNSNSTGGNIIVTDSSRIPGFGSINLGHTVTTTNRSRPSVVRAGSVGDGPISPSLVMGSIAEIGSSNLSPDHTATMNIREGDEFEPFAGFDGDGESVRSRLAYFRVPEGVTLVRRLVFEASEGPVAVLRHYDTATQSILVVAMTNGIIHGVDLRSRGEAWCCRLPSCMGNITAMEVCPGSTSILIGTDRGIITMYDTRFDLLVSAWRHSARSPIYVLYPFITLGIRGCTYGNNPNAPLTLSTCRQLAFGVGTGELETSFWNYETGVCIRILRTLPEQVHVTDTFRVPFLSRISLINGRVAPQDEVSLNSTFGLSSFTRNSSDVIDRTGTKHALQSLAEELTYRRHPSHIRAILCPLPSANVPVPGYLGLPDDTIDPSRMYAEALAVAGLDGTNSPLPGSTPSNGMGLPGLGFVLGGMRGAGAVRRRNHGFELGYRASTNSIDTALGSLTSASGLGTVTTTNNGSTNNAGLSNSTANGSVNNNTTMTNKVNVLVNTYGSSPAEGLPVWILTAGTDGQVRCWDLDRPRASHTICGGTPAVPRDGYEGAWAKPTDPQFWDADNPSVASISTASVSSQSPASVSSSSSSDLVLDTAKLEENLASLRLIQPLHFLTYHTPDGISNRRPVPNTKLLEQLGLPVHLFSRAQYAYWWQRGHPVRMIVSMPLSSPAKEIEASGSSSSSSAQPNITTNPYIEMKGPLAASTAHTSFITALAWLDLPTRLLITASRDGTIKIWR